MPLLLTPKVIADLAKIVKDHVGAAAVVIFGRDAVGEDAYKLAVDMGLIDPENPGIGIARLLHMFGAYAAMVGHKEAETTTLADFREIARKRPPTPEERRSAEFAEAQGAAYMVNAATRLTSRVTEAAAAADQETYTDLRSAARDAVAARFGDEDAKARMDARGPAPKFFDRTFRGTVKQIESDIGHLTGEWKRDLRRIAQTEMTAAVHRGQQARWEDQEADAVARGKPPDDILVYKVPRPGHCAHCARLYLDGNVPRIFRLRDVSGNSNIGRKAADWVFVVGPTHPWCACVFFRVPAFVRLSPGWRPGEADPLVIGPEGRLVAAGKGRRRGP